MSILYVSAVWTVTRDRNLSRVLLTQSNNMGQVREPLLHIDAIDCPPDILHMRKAVYSKLLDQIVTFSIMQKHHEKVVQEMTRIGINFRLVWNCTIVALGNFLSDLMYYI